MALTLCASLESGAEDQKQAASNVWYNALIADWDFFTDILYGKQINLTDDGIANSVLQKSVFGKLVEECDKCKKSAWGEVGIDISCVCNQHLLRVIGKHETCFTFSWRCRYSIGE